jgi:hypothetical protein
MFASKTGNTTSLRKIALVTAIAGTAFALESAVAYELVARPLAAGVSSASKPAALVTAASTRPQFSEDIVVRAPQGWQRLAGRSVHTEENGEGELREIDGRLAYCVPAEPAAR